MNCLEPIANMMHQLFNQLECPNKLFNNKDQESLGTQIIIDTHPYRKHQHSVQANNTALYHWTNALSLSST